ncbi:hypothetical protein M0802_005765 [Mischocyttarus mexicanus]|nr:hypothetical protein M0802_005765 [Mischocyttarus mexicanus]
MLTSLTYSLYVPAIILTMFSSPCFAAQCKAVCNKDNEGKGLESWLVHARDKCDLTVKDDSKRIVGTVLPQKNGMSADNVIYLRSCVLDPKILFGGLSCEGYLFLAGFLVGCRTVESNGQAKAKAMACLLPANCKTANCTQQQPTAATATSYRGL